MKQRKPADEVRSKQKRSADAPRRSKEPPAEQSVEDLKVRTGTAETVKGGALIGLLGGNYD